ncbi:hypothetical protein [Psychromonas algicola]|uniref:hypothetical protein n=1 Tax=Psychromonas algicola TaxID=2555642 RepID=UPI0010681BAE|nr:hypothetical protein [Psychromonas sp. RZ5]TEW52995.1 hypothetical protein E2R67_00905 [Psychromonas sp. RZ5]
MKKLSMIVVSGLTAFSITSLQASELSYLYKDQRIMAAGGTNISTGGYSTSLFSNPAGIGKVSNEHGVVFELLGIQLGVSSDSEGLVTDLSDAIDSEETSQILDVFADYSGQTTHIDASNYTSLTNKHEKLAWSFGVLSAVDANFTPHANSYNLLEVQARAYGGITSALSYDFQPSELGDLTVGLGAKYIYQISYEGSITPSELVNFDTIGDNLQDKMESNGSAIAADLGVIYQFNVVTNPSIGLSILNIGDLDFDESYGSLPMTVNIGASIEPNIPYIKKTTVALDYVDVLNANQTRLYDLGDGDTATYTDIEDTDVVKRVRFGVSTLLYENSWSTFELAGGVYQGAYTAGMTFTALIFKVGFTTYQEQLGLAYGDQEDRRYNLNVSIGW